MDFDFAKPPPELIPELDQIAREIRFNFVNFIDEISYTNRGDVFYWISNLASRNITASTLFLDFCKFELLRRLLPERRIQKLVLPSFAHLQILWYSSLKDQLGDVQVYINNKRIDLHSPWKSPFSKSIKKAIKRQISFFVFLKGYLKHTIFAVYKKRKRLRRVPAPRLLSEQDEIILFHTYLSKKSFVDWVFRDRYFTDLPDYLTEKEKKNIYFIFTPYEFEYNQSNLELIRNNPSLIIKDDYLKWIDYFYAFLFPFRIRRIKLKNTTFSDFDFGPLLKASIHDEFWSYSNGATSIYFEAIFNLRLLKRLRQRGVKIKKVIDWFENQWMNRGLYYGLKKYYPQIPSIGYEGYIIDLIYLSVFPSQAEVSAGVVPKTIAVIGNGLKNRLRQFCENLDVITAPAFRYSHVYGQARSRVKRMPTTQLLFLLPYLTDMAEVLLDVAKGLSEELSKRGLRFKFRPHPVVEEHTVKLIKKYGFSESIISSVSLAKDLSESCVVLSYESSSTMEALAYGLPVVLLGSQHGLTLNPIPESVPEDFWRLCYTENQVLDAVLHFLERDNSDIKKYSETLKRDFFEPVSREAVFKFLE